MYFSPFSCITNGNIGIGASDSIMSSEGQIRAIRQAVDEVTPRVVNV
jgi:hypothetical protein